MPPQPPTQKNAEIDQALKEFEAKNIEQTSQTPKAFIVPQKKVEGISFETDNLRNVNQNQETDTPKMVKTVMKLSGGKIKNQRQAEYLLFFIVCIIVLISIVIIYHSAVVSPAQPTALPPDYSLYHNQTQ